MKSKGFTIVEIIVVIAIISVLASVVVVGVGQYMQKAKDARLRADFVEIEKAAKLDYANCGNWAPDVGTGDPPRFVRPDFIYIDGINNRDCSGAEVVYPGSDDAFSARYYCSTCNYDWENRDSCIAIGINDGSKTMHGHIIEDNGCNISGFINDF